MKKQSIIIDKGSQTIKCGFSNYNSDSHDLISIFPCIIGRLMKKNIGYMIGMEDNTKRRRKTWFIGNEVLEKRKDDFELRINYPIKRGQVMNWNDMEKIWSYVFENELKVKSEEYKVMVTENPLNEKKNREKETIIMFEHFDVSGFYIANHCVLSLYASGRTTGVVCSSGDGVTYTSPVYEGYILPHSVLKMEQAGKDVSDYLYKIIKERGYELTISEGNGMEIINDIKEKLCYISFDYEDELTKFETSDKHIEKKYKLPDGKVIEIGSEMFRACEIMFKPSFIGSEMPGIHEMIFNSIHKGDIDIRKELYQNIFLSGGNTMFKGMGDRFSYELQRMAPKNAIIKVHTPSERKLSVWFGGSILSSLSSFDKLWITKNDYDEAGASIVHRKCCK